MATTILTDIATALEDLDGRVVHRDLKLENVLLLDGRWRLVDFGIARYAEATTAPDTHKYAMTAPYAAPEQWRGERATGATDIYALGVMAYEMLAGGRPFAGPGDEYRHQHLHQVPARLQTVSVPLAALVSECLHKQPESRPSAAEVSRRLQAAGGSEPRPRLAALQEAHEAEISQQAQAQAARSAADSARERQEGLFTDARNSFGDIAEALSEALTGAAPSITRSANHDARWVLRLGDATLRLSEPVQEDASGSSLPFEVIAHAILCLEGRGASGYRGRSHSLWYCDAKEAGRFAWYETAFMETLGGGGTVAPFALSPREAAVALSPAMGTKQLARSFHRLSLDTLDEFVRRWGEWFAAAYNGTLRHPMQLPEEDIQGSYRRSR